METVSVQDLWTGNVPNISVALRAQNSTGLLGLGLLDICKIEVVLLLLHGLTNYICVLWRATLLRLRLISPLAL